MLQLWYDRPMDTRFKEKLELNEFIEKTQNEIDKLLLESPGLGILQREIEERLDKVGDVRTLEGRINRSALMFSLLKESFAKFRDGLEDYQKDLADNLEAKKNKAKLTII
jgi:hypothetical protein